MYRSPFIVSVFIVILLGQSRALSLRGNNEERQDSLDDGRYGAFDPKNPVAEDDKDLVWRALINPVFHGAGLITNVESAQMSRRIRLVMNQRLNFRLMDLEQSSPLKLKSEERIDENTHIDELINHNITTRKDTLLELKDQLVQHPGLFQNYSLCHHWPFIAKEEIRAFGGNRTLIGISETNFCFHNLQDKKSFIHPMCSYGGNTYRYVSIALKEHVGPEDTFVPYYDASLMLFDESGMMRYMKLTLTDGGSFKSIDCNPGKFKSTGVLELDIVNNNPNRKFDLSPEQEKAKSAIARDVVTSWEAHFNYSTIESISFFRSNLYFTRGLKLVKEMNKIDAIGPDAERYVPHHFLEGYDRLSIQALEVYALDEVLYMHAAMVKYGQSNMLTDVFPVLAWCRVKNEFYPKIWGSRDCIERQLNETLMPVDFVFYKTRQCPGELIVFYQYTMRFLPPNSSLIEKGNDYTHYPHKPYEWMTKTTESLKAVMFHEGKFYFFTTANRVFIDRKRAYGGCGSLSDSSGPMEWYYASDLMLQYARRFNSIFNRTSINYVFDPYRTGRLDKAGSTQLIWEPDLYESKKIPDNLLIDSGRNGVTPEEPRPGPKPGDQGANDAHDAHDGSSLSTIIFVCVLLILIAIMAAIVYYFYFASSDEAKRKSRKSSTKKTQPQSGIDAQLTARSALASPSGSSATSRKSVRSPMVSPKTKSPKSRTKSLKSISPRSRTKSLKTISPKSRTKSLKSTSPK